MLGLDCSHANSTAKPDNSGSGSMGAQLIPSRALRE
jgi:hypothetical protein